MYNHCLRESCFPRNRKQAIAVYFPKEGKDPKLASSCQPISLLPAAGKLLEKLCSTRLAIHLGTRGVLDRRQFGFRRKLCTVDALEELLECMAESKRQSSLFALDIKSAFNSVRRTDVLRFLVEYGVDTGLLGLMVPSSRKEQSLSIQGITIITGSTSGVVPWSDPMARFD